MRTRGQPAALLALDAMLRGGLPHAILLTGPARVGKTTLALDLAAALLCGAREAGDRPCRSCRACRMVDGGNHPDLHRLAPGGAGMVIGIGGADRDPGVRELIGHLALMPVEGGARVAVIEGAHRMQEAAQSALLKTLEEPPEGVVLILCAEDEERMLPTVRSRCARVRLGPVGIRDIEALLGELGLADAPRAARLARIAGGRPGLAVVYARAADAQTIRAEIARRLLDLRGNGIAPALVAIRELQARAVDLGRTLDAAAADAGAGARGGHAATGGRGARGRAAKTGVRAGASDPGFDAGADATPGDGGTAGGAGSDAEAAATGTAKLAAPERRRGANVLLGTWADVTRDLALLRLGERRSVREIALLDDLEATLSREPTTTRDPSAEPAAFLARLVRGAELVEGNAAPELVLDTLAVAWGRPDGGDVAPKPTVSARVPVGRR